MDRSINERINNLAQAGAELADVVAALAATQERIIAMQGRIVATQGRIIDAVERLAAHAELTADCVRVLGDRIATIESVCIRLHVDADRLDRIIPYKHHPDN